MPREFIRDLSNQLRLWLARDGVGRQYRMDFQCPNMAIFLLVKNAGEGTSINNAINVLRTRVEDAYQILS